MKMKIIQRERSNIVLLLIFTYFIFIESSAITDITKEALKHSVIEIVILLSFANVHKQIFYVILKIVIQKKDTPLYLDLCLKGFQIFFISGLGFSFSTINLKFIKELD